MLKETESDETIGYFATFLSLVAFRLGEAQAPPMATPMPRSAGPKWLHQCVHRRSQEGPAPPPSIEIPPMI